jgi:quercetin dioxygenase-like cupin family protein
MKVQRFAELKRFAAERMQKVNLFEGERFLCDLHCLEPGQAARRHAHDDQDKIYVVLEGELVVQVGAATATLHPGEAVLAEAGVEHGVQNLSAEPAVALVFLAQR